MTYTDEAVERALLPCPFCGGHPEPISEQHLSPTMKGPGALISASVRHHCPRESGTVHAFIEFRGRDRTSAIAAWNRRALAARKEALEDAAKVVAANMTLDLSSMRDPPSESTGWNDAVRSCVAAIRAMKEPT